MSAISVCKFFGQQSVVQNECRSGKLFGQSLGETDGAAFGLALSGTPAVAQGRNIDTEHLFGFLSARAAKRRCNMSYSISHALEWNGEGLRVCKWKMGSKRLVEKRRLSPLVVANSSIGARPLKSTRAHTGLLFLQRRKCFCGQGFRKKPRIPKCSKLFV